MPHTAIESHLDNSWWDGTTLQEPSQYWIATATGGDFSFDMPRSSDVNIEDIAVALSHVCRFGGHCKWHYSVAQHSVLVSRLCPTMPLAGLLHDAAESYVGDIPHPLKQWMREHCPAFIALERRIEFVVAEALGVLAADWHCREVKDADFRLLATEKRDLMNCRREWAPLPEPLTAKLVPWTPEESYRAFMYAYKSLRGVEHGR